MLALLVRQDQKRYARATVEDENKSETNSWY